MAEKTLGEIARDTWGNATGPTSVDDWQAVADAVIAEYERRRWKAWENVPRDGSKFDAWHTGSAWVSPHRLPDCHINVFGEVIDSQGSIRDENFLSHWTALPAPPKGADDAA